MSRLWRRPRHSSTSEADSAPHGDQREDELHSANLPNLSEFANIDQADRSGRQYSGKSGNGQDAQGAMQEDQCRNQRCRGDQTGYPRAAADR